jgi:hypothetical protein
LSQPQVEFRARILRKRDDLPRYVVVKPEHAFGAREAFEAWVSLNGASRFKRNIRPWGKGSDVFFFNLAQPQCREAGLETGDECIVTMSPISERVR